MLSWQTAQRKMTLRYCACWHSVHFCANYHTTHSNHHKYKEQIIYYMTCSHLDCKCLCSIDLAFYMYAQCRYNNAYTFLHSLDLSALYIWCCSLNLYLITWNAYYVPGVITNFFLCVLILRCIMYLNEFFWTTRSNLTRRHRNVHTRHLWCVNKSKTITFRAFYPSATLDTSLHDP